MTVEQCLNPKRRVNLGEILVCKPRKCAGVSRPVGSGLQGVNIGAAFAPARICVFQRPGQQLVNAQYGCEQRQCIGVRRIWKAEALHAGLQSQMRNIETAEREHAAHKNARWNIAVDMVAQFVGHDGFDFIGGELLQQCVSQYNAARVADAHQRGIGALGAAAEVEGVDTAHARVGARSQRQQALLQMPEINAQRLHLKEERDDDKWREVREQHIEQQQRCPKPKPPC